MKGAVLAAGLGTRLAPLSAECPKALLPVVNVAAMEYALDNLRRASVHQVGVNAHSLAHRLEDYMEARPDDGLDLHLVTEQTLLGTAGGIAGLARELDATRLAVQNADMLAPLDWRAIEEKHRRSGFAVTAIVFPAAPGKSAPLALSDDGDEVIDLLGSIAGLTGQVDYLGASMLDSSFVDRLPPSGCLVRDGMIPYLRDGGHIGAYFHQGYARDLGTPSRFLTANLECLGGRGVPTPSSVVAMDEREGSICVARTARIGHDVRLGPNVIVGPDAEIGEGASLESTVVLPRACVEAGARLHHGVMGREWVPIT